MEQPPEVLPFQLTLRTGSERQLVEGAVPNAPMTLVDFLPLLWQLDEVIVSAAEREIAAGDEHVTCAKGCGACCRQLVPISEAEAAHIAKLVDDFPEPRRSVVRQRFADAAQQAAANGFLDGEWDCDRLDTAQQRHAFSERYFRLGIPCPFLEDEACSIHAERPLVCREYLVVSDPAACASLDGIRQIALPNVASSFLYRFGGDLRWLPLVLALDFDHAGSLRAYPGPALVERLVMALGMPPSELPGLGRSPEQL